MIKPFIFRGGFGESRPLRSKFLSPFKQGYSQGEREISMKYAVRKQKIDISVKDCIATESKTLIK